LGLREIKADLKRYNVRPSKRLGQSFLIDANIQGKILNAVDINRSDIILEIGPGLGALTQGLCARAGKVIAIEKDKRLCEFLQQTYSASNLEILNADILDYLDVIDMPNERIKVAGNLPYCITSPIITGLLKKRQFFSGIFVTVQNEFADRLIASPGGKEYGSISCFAQFYADIKILFRIKRTCFYPEPKVDSSFVRLIAKERGLCLTDEEKLFKIIRTSFGKRRKTIFNSLKSCDLFLSTKEIMEALEHAGIAHDRRPETVSLEEFVKLTRAAGSRRIF